MRGSICNPSLRGRALRMRQRRWILHNLTYVVERVPTERNRPHTGVIQIRKGGINAVDPINVAIRRSEHVADHR